MYYIYGVCAIKKATIHLKQSMVNRENGFEERT